jgi:hypothetical protein
LDKEKIDPFLLITLFFLNFKLNNITVFRIDGYKKKLIVSPSSAVNALEETVMIF